MFGNVQICVHTCFREVYTSKVNFIHNTFLYDSFHHDTTCEDGWYMGKLKKKKNPEVCKTKICVVLKIKDKTVYGEVLK